MVKRRPDSVQARTCRAPLNSARTGGGAATAVGPGALGACVSFAPCLPAAPPERRPTHRVAPRAEPRAASRTPPEFRPARRAARPRARCGNPLPRPAPERRWGGSGASARGARGAPMVIGVRQMWHAEEDLITESTEHGLRLSFQQAVLDRCLTRGARLLHGPSASRRTRALGVRPWVLEALGPFGAVDPRGSGVCAPLAEGPWGSVAANGQSAAAQTALPGAGRRLDRRVRPQRPRALACSHDGSRIG